MKESGFRVGFPIGAVFFGSLVGPSMVSGIYSKVYLVPYGMWGFVFALFFPLISSVIIGFSAELVRRNNVYDYNSFCRVLYGKLSFICTPVMEIYMLMAQVLTLSAVVTMGGSMLNDIFGLPDIIGTLILAALCLLLVLWGAELVRKAASTMCVILMIGFIVLVGLAVHNRADEFSNMVTSWYVPEGANVGLGVWNAILFGFSGACNGMVLCSLMQKVKTKKHSFSTGLWCFILTSIVLIMEVLVILPYVPDVLVSEIPTLWIIDNWLVTNIPWLPALYHIIMFFALITSGVPANQAIISRVQKILPGKGIFRHAISAKALIGIGFLILVLLVSRLGLTTIVSSGYSSLGAIGIPLIAIPTCIIMPIKWYRKRKEEDRNRTAS